MKNRMKTFHLWQLLNFSESHVFDPMVNGLCLTWSAVMAHKDGPRNWDWSSPAQLITNKESNQIMIRQQIVKSNEKRVSRSHQAVTISHADWLLGLVLLRIPPLIRLFFSNSKKILNEQSGTIVEQTTASWSLVPSIEMIWRGNLKVAQRRIENTEQKKISAKSGRAWAPFLSVWPTWGYFCAQIELLLLFIQLKSPMEHENSNEIIVLNCWSFFEFYFVK